MGLKNIIVGLVLFSIAVFGLLTFGIQLADDNGASNSIANDTRISTFRTNVESEITNTESNINATFQVFEETEQSGGDTQDFLEPLTLRSIGLGIITAPYSVLKLTFGLIGDKIFGGSSPQNYRFLAVLGILATLVGAVIILYIVRWIRSGEVD